MRSQDPIGDLCEGYRARIRSLERAMRKCIDDCADMSGALPIQTHALRWMTWLENALQATEAETTGDAK